MTKARKHLDFDEIEEYPSTIPARDLNQILEEQQNATK